MSDAYIHPRTEWEKPSQRISGPAPKGTPDTWVVHYPGASASWKAPETYDECVDLMQRMQNDYVTTRGYSLGYGVVVSQSGRAFEARGTTASAKRHNMASNPGRKIPGRNMNDTTVSIMIAVSGQDAASPAAVAKVNAIIATEPTWKVIVHGDIDHTSCAGEGIIAQVRAGIIGHQPEPTPTPTPTQEPAIMSDLYELDPIRASDTRVWPGIPVNGRQAYQFGLPADAVPANARAVMATITGTGANGAGHVTVWRKGAAKPATSCLNFAAGQTIANTTLIPVKNRQFNIEASSPIHLIVDVVGYLA